MLSIYITDPEGDVDRSLSFSFSFSFSFSLSLSFLSLGMTSLIKLIGWDENAVYVRVECCPSPSPCPCPCPCGCPSLSVWVCLSVCVCLLPWPVPESRFSVSLSLSSSGWPNLEEPAGRIYRRPRERPVQANMKEMSKKVTEIGREAEYRRHPNY